jgi:hypothetical protein
MMDNISRYWPDYSARAVTTLDDAKQLVRSHKPMDHPQRLWAGGERSRPGPSRMIDCHHCRIARRNPPVLYAAGLRSPQ